MLFLANYLEADENAAGSSAGCVTQANTFWSVFYYIAAICLFFLLPLIVLVLIYSVIARHLVADPCTASNHRIQVRPSLAIPWPTGQAKKKEGLLFTTRPNQVTSGNPRLSANFFGGVA